MFARQILRHFQLDAHFHVVVGSYRDGRRADKTAVLRRALHVLGAAPDDTVMIGDRVHDITAAQACAVAAQGVRWGYASPGELEAAAPLAIFDTSNDLLSTLLGGRH